MLNAFKFFVSFFYWKNNSCHQKVHINYTYNTLLWLAYHWHVLCSDKALLIIRLVPRKFSIFTFYSKTAITQKQLEDNRNDIFMFL